MYFFSSRTGSMDCGFLYAPVCMELHSLSHTAEAGSHELPGSLVHSKQVLNISGGIAQW